MIVKEYRVILPMTVEEYQVAQLWTVIEASKDETGGGDGVEILVNEPFSLGSQYAPEKELPGGGIYSSGQYTHKIYHLASKVPSFIRLLAPGEALNVTEKAWNAYPYCRTVITNGYMKDAFFLKVETMHVQDKIDIDNVHELPPDMLAKREVIYVDIAADLEGGVRPEWDPKTFQSKTTGRGPLVGPRWWEKTDMPIMCAYKLVTCNFRWFGIQGLVESYIAKTELRLFHTFHRQLFCNIDKWHGLSMEDIRRMEEQTKLDLDKQRKEGKLQGTIETK
ncbi:Phosphatidylinositol transfer protein alpha isoform [Echinococcus granulosus]|uniref:Phosphatidylinositol transfer protein alpha isoform n=2 Tax=Echinococcus granulosus TaxID=6210 RepID=W6UUU8_ECHGR|nr:Phosphatidylinositol transfer protein alpha isoform [Echinococcus granulosus]EUB57184.1 Phosphatidylinositol transfer protein alpha isoform [Echinococcus granulosus]KAH9286897.1 Phosphatidylinositol transfer protein alpha isoform [Echinococcus granulosus]